MKISEILLEETGVNIGVLADLIEVIKKSIPKQLPKNQVYVFTKWNDSDLQELKQKYKNSEKIIEALSNIENLRIIFNNTEKSKNVSELGFYRNSDSTIVVNVSRIKSNSDIVNLRKSNLVTKKIWQTVFHELRHVFQFSEYGDYIKSTSVNQWEQKTTEWDAVWSDLLYAYNPDQYEKSIEYANMIVSQLQKTLGIELPPKVYKNYLRKTASYHQTINLKTG